jgi:hypothetical protein
MQQAFNNPTADGKEWNPTTFIKNYWGFTAGKYYADGVELFNGLGLHKED